MKTIKLLNKEELNIWLTQYDKLPEWQRLYMYGRSSFGYITYKYVVSVENMTVTVTPRLVDVNFKKIHENSLQS